MTVKRNIRLNNIAMEKPAKAKSKFLKFLPRAASAVTFRNPNPPFSPSSKDKRSESNANKLKNHAGKGLSGAVVSLVPKEARRKPKNSSFEAQEPTSPKVSCMGQIKHKTKIKKQKHLSSPKDFKPSSSPLEAKKKPSSTNRNPFGRAKSPSRKSDSSVEKPDRAPSLGQMKRFASGRDSTSLTNFDWTAQVAPVDADHRNYYSDEENEGEEREVIIPFSAPILVGGGGGGSAAALEPKKEINLWKRRTMAQPRPLQVNTAVVD